jgi:hypothetical protein
MRDESAKRDAALRFRVCASRFVPHVQQRASGFYRDGTGSTQSMTRQAGHLIRGRA